jgi:hypothetical protein
MKRIEKVIGLTIVLVGGAMYPASAAERYRTARPSSPMARIPKEQ